VLAKSGVLSLITVTDESLDRIKIADFCDIFVTLLVYFKKTILALSFKTYLLHFYSHHTGATRDLFGASNWCKTRRKKDK